MDLQSVFERFAAAVSVLALSADSLQERLAAAFIEEKLILLTEDDFPTHLQKGFEDLRNGMRDHGRRRIDQVLQHMTEKQAEHYIRIILDLHSGIAKEIFGGAKDSS
jgi:hypothetical protein